MVFINNYMDLQNDMHFYQEKFPSTHTTYNSIKLLLMDMMETLSVPCSV